MSKISKYPYYEFSELQTRFKDSWVLLMNPDSEPAKYAPKGGYFVYKNKNKAKTIEKSLDESLWQGEEVKSVAIIYTGEIKLPKDHIICL